MKIFLSSLITGMEEYRAAAVRAIEGLDHTPVNAESFPATDNSPKVACLNGVREAALVVLILGADYGATQPSGLSATHEEYREAKGARPVLAFVQENVVRDAAQHAFLTEVQDWEGGLFRAGFQSPEQLALEITRAIHRWELSNAAAPVDPSEMLEHALSMLSTGPRGRGYNSNSLVHISLVGGPVQPILRPVEIERSELADTLLQHALFGSNPIFDRRRGSETNVRDGVLHIIQDEGLIALDERGGIHLIAPLAASGGAIQVIIQEEVEASLKALLSYASWLLDAVDPTQRLSRFVIAAKLTGLEYSAWRTRAEHAASPNSVTLSHNRFGRDQDQPVHFEPADRARGTLSFGVEQLVEDLTALLRRQWQ